MAGAFATRDDLTGFMESIATMARTQKKGPSGLLRPIWAQQAREILPGMRTNELPTEGSPLSTGPDDGGRTPKFSLHKYQRLFSMTRLKLGTQ